MEEQTETANEPTSTETTEPTTDNPTLESNEADDPATDMPGGDAEMPEEEPVITADELEELLQEYTNTKSDVTVLVDEASGREAIIEVVHSVTLGDIYIMLLLLLLIITTLLTRLIGRR